MYIWPAVCGIGFVVVVLLLWLVSVLLHVCEEGQLLVVSGVGGGSDVPRRIVRGEGWTVAWPWLNEVHRFSMRARDILLTVENVETSDGYRVTVRGRATLRPVSKSPHVRTLVEKFSGEPVEEYDRVGAEVLRRNLRGLVESQRAETLEHRADDMADELLESMNEKMMEEFGLRFETAEIRRLGEDDDDWSAPAENAP